MHAKSVQYRAPVRGGEGYGKKGVICTFWLQGRCNRNPCRFVHRAMALPTSYIYNRTAPYPQISKHVSREDGLNSKKSSHTNGSHLYPEEWSVSYRVTAKKDAQATCDVGRINGKNKNESHQYSQESSISSSGTAKKEDTQATCDVGRINWKDENEFHQHSQESSISSSGTAEKDSRVTCDAGRVHETDENESRQCSQESPMSSSGTFKKEDTQATCDGVERVMAPGGHKKTTTGIALPLGLKNEIDGNESHQYPQESSISCGGTTKKDVQATCNDVDKPQCLHSFYMGDGVERLAELEGHKKVIAGIALPVGSQHLYTGSGDGTVRAWNCYTSQCEKEQNLGSEIGSLISEGPWMFVGLKNVIRVGNIHTSIEYNLDAPFGQVYALETSGKDMLFAGMQDGSILVWKYNPEADAFQLITNLKGHTGCVLSLKVGEQSLYSGSMDNTIRKWDLETLQCSQTLSSHSAAVTSLLYWGSYLFSCSMDRTIKVWSITEAGCVEAIHTHNEEHGVLALLGMFDADNKPILFSSQEDSSVHLYELPSFVEKGKIFGKQKVRNMQSGPGGLFFTGDEAGGVGVWRWASREKDSRRGD